MILPDANLLLYAIDEHSPNHARASAWFEDALSGADTVAFSWVALLAFVRLSTHSGVFASPLPVERALASIESWLEQPTSLIIQPGPRHLHILGELLGVTGTAGNLVPDAHIAAVAIEHGAVVATNDRDFGRFPGLKVTYPLSEA